METPMTRHISLPMHETTTDTLCGACGARNFTDKETWCDNGMLHDGDQAPLVAVMSSTRKGAHVVNAHRHAKCIAAEEATETARDKAIRVLGVILQRMRWDDQGGYPHRHDGAWTFVSTGLPQTTPEELDILFAGCGIEPDEIESLGPCAECAHARVLASGERVERGYQKPCLGCLRPRHSNFVRAK
jgi:hypothetical protein